MKPGIHFRKSNVILVKLDEFFALIDQEQELIYTINESAAWIWKHLSNEKAFGELNIEEYESFIEVLKCRNLASKIPNHEKIDIAVQFNGYPEIVSTTALQVAANNSDDPFVNWRGSSNDIYYA